jgi:ABC-2 type transport system permease protein
MALVQPLLFLFVLGSGLNSLSAASAGGVDLTTFVFPGVLGMTVLFTAIFTAASLVWDRELGFLSEMLVAPVSRASIVLGKCLGGSIIAASHGVVVLALAGLVGVPYDPVLVLGLLGMMLLLAVTVTAFGLLVAVSIRQAQTFTAMMQMFVMPMFFVSGAFFPVSGLPDWLGVLNRIDPLTYAIDPMRRLVFDHLDISASARGTLDPGVTWWSWHLPPVFEVAMVLLMGLALIGAAIRRFSRTK